MKKLKKLKEFFEWNLDGYDVALAIIGSLIGVFLGTLIFLEFYLKIKNLTISVITVVAKATARRKPNEVNQINLLCSL